MQEITDLVHSQRWGALATLDENGHPSASAVAFGVDPAKGRFLFLLSGLAEHTRNLAERPEASLLIGVPDSGEGNPQTLPRFSVKLRVDRVPRDDPRFAELAACYLAKLPDSEMLFGLGDFQLLSGAPLGGNYVGGFGRATTLEAEQVRELLLSRSS